MKSDPTPPTSSWGEALPKPTLPRRPLVLASSSPRRQELLTLLGVVFRVDPPTAPEPPASGFASVEAYVTATAAAKALEVSNRPEHAGRWVLAADTVAEVDGAILGKPTDRADAERILGMLMGTVHRTWTGVALRSPAVGCALVAAECTTVEMRRPEPRELKAYLDSGLWEGKAGAYGIQLAEDPFVARIAGSFSNVMGLPFALVAALLAAASKLE